MMQFRTFLFFSMLATCLACQSKSWNKIVQIPEVIPAIDYEVPPGLPSANSWKSYTPDSMYLDHIPVRTARVNVHFMNSLDSTKNYNGKMAKSYSWSLVNRANKKLANNKPARLPLHNNIPVLPTRYKYKLATSVGKKSAGGTYVHYDDDLYFYVKEGKNKNIGNREVMEKYGVERESIINVFMMPHHPDSIKSPTYSGGLTGVAMGYHTKIATTSTDKNDAYKNTSNFNHEMGHIFGLPHSWGSDGCDDTPKHNNKCWNFTKNGSVCDSMVSNNLMSYNISQNSISPCQIGRIHKKMAKHKSPLRNYLIRDWCDHDSENPIVITDEIFWTGHKDLPNDIIIKKGGSLYISSRISMAPGSKIMVEGEGKLILDGARLHSDCDSEWKGIWQSTKGTAQVIYLNDPKLENVAGAIVADDEGSDKK